MEKLLEMARKVCDKAEIYSLSQKLIESDFEASKLQEVNSNILSGISLRIIKDGKMGFAYTRNLNDRQEVLDNALNSLKGQVEAKYDFPLTKDLPDLNKYSETLSNIGSNQLVEEGNRVCSILNEKTGMDVCSGAFFEENITRIMNTENTDITNKSNNYGLYYSTIFPGTASGVGRMFLKNDFNNIPDSELEEIINYSKFSNKIVNPKTEKMKAIFMPNSFYTIGWRINTGLNGKSIHQGISPIADKIGQKIFSDKITYIDNPLDKSYPNARTFDDEGVGCKPLTLIENGVLKDFYYDLEYASKLGKKSTGHGYRSGAMFGADPLSTLPSPSLQYASIKPGDRSLSDMIKSMDKGVIIENVLGAHSGNIPNGDFSVGIEGFYVENGEIVGRCKDVMAAGNIYELLNNVDSVSNKHDFSVFGHLTPAILFDDVSIAAQ